MTIRKTKTILHKVIHDISRLGDSWGFLCTPIANNSSRKSWDFKKKNSRFHWRLVTCRLCLSLREDVKRRKPMTKLTRLRYDS